MPRFFISSSDVEKKISSDNSQKTFITICGDDALHITKVLRMKNGEHLTVCDTDRIEYDTVVVTTGKTVLLEAISEKKSENDPPYRIDVYQALAKGERFDTVLQKSTELGASDIIPVVTSRCTVKLEPSEYAKKIERWQRIVSEAAKQCGRTVIPIVHMPMFFEDAVREAALCDLSLFCYEGDGTRSLRVILDETEEMRSASIMIGPEGGYSMVEAEFAAEAGMHMTGLGRRILRTETAAPVVLSCISYKYEL